MTHLVEGLPSLAEREKHLEKNQAATPSDQLDELKTKEEYVRGVSNWNFGSILALRDGSRSTPIKQRPETIKEKTDAILEELVTPQISDKTQEQQSTIHTQCCLLN